MSLINEALKRAQEVQQTTPPPIPPQQLKPVEKASRRTGFNIFVVGMVAVLLVAGGGLIWMSLQNRKPIQVYATTIEKPVPQIPVSDQEKPPAAATTVEAARVENTTASHAPEAAPTTNKLPKTADSVAHAAQVALPKLRGIFYNPSRPSAVLNSKTVFVGDSVSGFKVVEITAESVKVELAGKVSELTLSE